MPSLTAELMTPTALERFQDELNAIYVIRREHKRIIQLLEQELETAKQQLEFDERLLYEAQADKNEELINERIGKVKEDDEQIVVISNDLEIWERESPRQIAIKYCIASENFLRDFLIEQVLLKPENLEAYICRRVSLPISITKTSLIEEDVVDCISIEFRNFQELQGRVNDAYKKITSKKKAPFGKIDKSQNIFANEVEMESARDDIFLLFEIRHQLIHRNGRVSNNFSEGVNKKYEKRLNETFKNSSEGLMPSTDAILRSKAVVGGGDKVDEFAVSLRDYAEYITKVCG